MESKETPCEWIECGPEICYWETGCDNAQVFETGGVVENEYKFCPYCGNPIKAFPYTEGSDADPA